MMAGTLTLSAVGHTKVRCKAPPAEDGGADANAGGLDSGAGFDSGAGGFDSGAGGYDASAANAEGDDDGVEW